MASSLRSLHTALAGGVLAIFVIAAQTLGVGAGVVEILTDYGLPVGLLPATVKSYSLSENGKFEVKLSSSCTTKFGSEEVYYGTTLTGQASYGKIQNLGGIKAHEFFWVSVTGIEVDGSNPNIIWFKVGIFSKALNVDLFDHSPSCNSLSHLHEEEEEEDSEESLRHHKADRFVRTSASVISKALRGSVKHHVPNDFDAEATRKMLQRV